MRVRTKIWIAIIAACVVLTVYEIPHAVWILRCAWPDRSKHTSGGDLNIPAIVTDRLIAADPEAGDIFRYCLQYAEDGPDLEELAVLVNKHPDNEFFLSQLAFDLGRAGVVNPHAVLTVIDRLIDLNRENAHYRYLKGWVFLMRSDDPEHEQKALNHFEEGHALPQFYMPYSKYKERVDKLYAKTGLIWMRPHLWSFYNDLARYARRSSISSNKQNDGTTRALIESLARIGERVIENAYDAENFAVGAVLIRYSGQYKLRELDLLESEVEQCRLRLARINVLAPIWRQTGLLGMSFDDFAFLTFAPFPIVVAVCGIIGNLLDYAILHRRRRKSPVPVTIRILGIIDLLLAVVLVLLVLLVFTKEHSPGQPPARLLFVTAWFFLAYSAVVLEAVRFTNLARLHRPWVWTVVFCGSLWFKGAILWLAGNFGIFTVQNEAGLTLHIAVLVGWSVLCVLIWDSIIHSMSGQGLLNGRCIIMSTEWVIALMVLYIFGSRWMQMNEQFAGPLAQHRPLPKVTQGTYEQIILEKASVLRRSEDGKGIIVPEILAYVTPQHLETFLTVCRNKGESIPDKKLMRLLRYCSPDLRPIILNELTDPNSYDVLVMRAEWGDSGVKEQLDSIYQDRLAVYSAGDEESLKQGPSSLGELLQLAGVLTRLSDGPEGRQRLSYLLEEVVRKTRSLGIGPSLTDPRHSERIMRPFWAALSKLPRVETTVMLKSYLRQTKFVDFFGDRERDHSQLSALLRTGNRELAEEVVTALAGLATYAEMSEGSAKESADQRDGRLKRYRDRNSGAFLESVSVQLNVESIPLLLEHLDSDNDQLRAFIVWRLTSLGYEWSDEQLATLRQDSFWKVRMNSLFAHDRDDLETFVEDENPLVRTVTRILIDYGTP